MSDTSVFIAGHDIYKHATSERIEVLFRLLWGVRTNRKIRKNDTFFAVPW